MARSAVNYSLEQEYQDKVKAIAWKISQQKNRPVTSTEAIRIMIDAYAINMPDIEPVRKERAPA